MSTDPTAPNREPKNTVGQDRREQSGDGSEVQEWAVACRDGAFRHPEMYSLEQAEMAVGMLDSAGHFGCSPHRVMTRAWREVES